MGAWFVVCACFQICVGRFGAVFGDFTRKDSTVKLFNFWCSLKSTIEKRKRRQVTQNSEKRLTGWLLNNKLKYCCCLLNNGPNRCVVLSFFVLLSYFFVLFFFDKWEGRIVLIYENLQKKKKKKSSYYSLASAKRLIVYRSHGRDIFFWDEILSIFIIPLIIKTNILIIVISAVLYSIPRLAHELHF